MLRYRIIMAALFAGFLSAPAYAAGPISPVDVGNWHGGSYTNDTTGKFSHCAASAVYQNKMIFVVAVTKDYAWNLGFVFNAWHLKIGENIPVDLTFDGHGPYRVFAKVFQPNFVIISMPPTSELVGLFRGATQMTAFARGQLFPFALTDTSVMLPYLVQCVRNNSGRAAVPASPRMAQPQHLSTPPDASNSALTVPVAPTPDANPEVDAARNKLLADTANAYGVCIQNEMKQLVPLSNEGAETLAQVIITKCADIEQHYVELAMAMYGASRAQVEDLIHDPLETRKKNIIADIVTFRAELTKALTGQPKINQETESKTGQGL